MQHAPLPSLRDFERIVFFTGAGMSAESGVPTYRGKGGIWKEYDYTSCACEEAFRRDPEHVWEFHNYRRSLVAKCSPHRGHELVAEAEHQLPQVTVVTQNIDGLHQQAGSRRLLELHGSLWETRCEACGGFEQNRAAPLAEIQCRCGAYKRPNIVWFGDMLFESVLESTMSAIAECDLLISIGTSAVVYPAAQLPLLAKRHGATLIEVNPDETPLSAAYDRCVRGTASEALVELCASL